MHHEEHEDHEDHEEKNVMKFNINYLEKA